MDGKNESEISKNIHSSYPPLINININDDSDNGDKNDCNETVEFGPNLNFHKLKWNVEYVNALKNIFNVVQTKQYVPPSMPRAFLKAQNEKVNFLHVCEHCNDSFRLKSSLDDHQNRKTCIFGYWCSECSNVKCTHIHYQESTKDNSVCLSCKSKQNRGRVRLRQRGSSPKMKMGTVQVFLNPCQLISHTKMHTKNTIPNVDIDNIMHMPIPPEIEKIDDSSELNSIIANCKLLMEHAFINEKHVLDVLKELGQVKWWMSNNLDLLLLDQVSRKNSIDFSSNVSSDDYSTDDDSSSNSANDNSTCVDFSKMPVLDRSLINESPLSDYNKNVNKNNNESNGDCNDEEHDIVIDASTKGKENSSQSSARSQHEAFIKNGNSDANSLSIDNNLNDIAITFVNPRPELITISDDEEMLIDNYQLGMRRKFEQYSKAKIQALIDSVQQLSEDLLRANFFDSRAILENNSKFKKELEKYLETARTFESDGEEKFDVVENLLSKKLTTGQLLDNISSHDICRRCNKQLKPKTYKIGLTSESSTEENQYCQCYNFICHLCNSRQGNARRFKHHLKFHSLEPPHTCPECFAKFPNVHSLEVHMWAKCFHLNIQEIFRCNICQLEGFLTIEAITRHYYQFHSKLLFTCSKCQDIQTSYYQYLMHYNLRHFSDGKPNESAANPDPGILINCHFKGCLISPEAFSLHISEAHNEIAKVQYYTCPLCPFFVRNVRGNENIIQNHVFGSHEESLGAIMTSKTLNFFISAFNLGMSCSKNNSNSNSHNSDDLKNEMSESEERQERKMVIPKIVNACSIAPAVFDNGAQNSLIDQREVSQGKRCYRIALIDDNATFPSLKYKCHLCTEILPLNWKTIEHHFAVNHSQQYMLSTLKLRLERITQLEKDNRKRRLQRTNIDCSNKKCIVAERKLNHTNKPNESSCIVQQSGENIENTFKCRKCEEQFVSTELLREHISNIHRLKEQYLICLECGENFVVVNSLEIHLKACHGIDDTSIYLSENSTYAPNNNTSSYHVINTQLYRCNVCGTTFEEKVVADKHFRSHGLAFLRFRNMEVRSAQKNGEAKG